VQRSSALLLKIQPPETNTPKPPHPTQSAAWREFKERWGSTSLSDYKTNLPTSEKLLAAAATDAHLAAQMLWTLEVLADGCPQLAASLKRAGVVVGSGPLLALRTASSEDDDEGWCIKVLQVARQRAATEGRMGK